jgi:hypothetical protein
MRRYAIFDQRKPILVKRGEFEYEAHLQEVGIVEAASASDAIKLALRNHLSRWPMVREITKEAA